MYLLSLRPDFSISGASVPTTGLSAVRFVFDASPIRYLFSPCHCREKSAWRNGQKVYLTLYVQICAYRRFPCRIPLSTYGAIAFYTVGTMACSNSSVGYLNYPTQVIFKSCKLIPVLIGGILIQGKESRSAFFRLLTEVNFVSGKRYGWIDVLAAICMSVGLILFTLADNQVSPNFNVKGKI